jgi:uncharacterized membrane-anchored protein YitT (DUF2179 family)
MLHEQAGSPEEALAMKLERIDGLVSEGRITAEKAVEFKAAITERMSNCDGTAGLALAGSYIFNMSFSQIFFLINVSFYVFSYFQMGIKFTLSTIASVSLLSFLTGIISSSSFIPYTFPAFIGAIVGGSLVGLLAGLYSVLSVAVIGYIISINRNLSGSASAATGSTHSTATRKTATTSST